MASGMGVMSKNRVSVTISMVVLSSCLSLPHTNACESLDDFQWLLGQWKSTESTRVTTETWTRESTTQWNGVGSVVDSTDHEMVFTESLMLAESEKGIVYSALPQQNSEPTHFSLSNCLDNDLIFSNPTHDFPKSLRYQLKSPTELLVTVSGTVIPVEPVLVERFMAENKVKILTLSFSKQLKE